MATQADKDLVAAILGYASWDDACDYRTTGREDRDRERILNLVAAHRPDNPCVAIFDHKWLDPQCVHTGCQSLALKHLATLTRKLLIAARTTGGVAGPDEGLMQACDDAETWLALLDAKKMRRVTEQEIEAAMTPEGGWTKATLEAWGVPWPPPKGWKQRLIDGEVP